MSKQANQRIQKPDPTDSTSAWFAALESARLANDFERAAHAMKQLRRLGVRVQFVKPESKP